MPTPTPQQLPVEDRHRVVWLNRRGGGTWRTWFLGGTAVFLSLTAALKLMSVLSEARVLGTHDPLVSWLTQRQVLFTAALMETGVAYVLLQRPAGRRGAWLVLWLVAVFGMYRIGSKAIGFQGHCPCLGHVLAWLPGFTAWSDPVMVGVLVAMGVGSLWVLATQREGASSDGQAFPPQPRARGSRVTMSVAAAATLFTRLMPAAEARADSTTGAAHHSEDCRFRAVGETRTTIYDLKGAPVYSETGRFVYDVDGCRWFQECRTSLDNYLSVSENSYDGTNLYALTRASGRHGTARYELTASVQQSPVPAFSCPWTIHWLLFNGGCHLTQRTNQFTTVYRDRALRAPVNAVVEWESGETPPVVRSIAFQNPPGREHETYALLTVQEFAWFRERKLPRRTEMVLVVPVPISPGGATTNVLGTRWVTEVTEFIESPRRGFSASFEGRSGLTYDYRLDEASPKPRAFMYVTNRWLALTELEGAPGYAPFARLLRAVGTGQRKPLEARPRIAVLLLLVVALLPPVVFAGRRLWAGHRHARSDPRKVES